MSLIADLKDRKVFQWAVAYLASAWVLMQLIDVLGTRWGVTDNAARIDADWSRHVFQHLAADGSIAATRGPAFPPSDQPVTTR